MSVATAKPRAKEASMQPGRSSSLMEGIEDARKESAKGSGASAERSLDGKTIAMSVGAVAILVVAAFMIFRAVGSFGSSVGDATRIVVAADAETGKVFEGYRIKDGDTWPWPHPSTKNRTLYPTETCYWTSDGGAKLEPTYVILNSIVGKEGPTICPDCGREVVAHNPMPSPELLMKAAERQNK